MLTIAHAIPLFAQVTPCFECTLWLFPPQTKYPLCTLAETPRSAPHCIEYAKIAMWPTIFPEVEFDGDNAEVRFPTGAEPAAVRPSGSRGGRPRRATATAPSVELSRALC